MVKRRRMFQWQGWTWIVAALGFVGGPPLRAQGPELVKDILVGPAYSPGSNASLPVRYRGRDYFGADDGFLGYELWSTDGTPAGTRLFADLCPGRCGGNPSRLAVSGEFLFFVAGNTTLGKDSFWLWRTDGSPDGTFPLVDLRIDGFGSALPLTFLSRYGNGMVFVVNERESFRWALWFSDGTRAGTRRIKRLPGDSSRGGPPLDFDWPRVDDSPARHYFSWSDGLWVTDGTDRGTHPVETPVEPCGGWARLGRLAIYAGEHDRENCEPWVTDGTAAGTHPLRDVVPGSDPSFPQGFVVAGEEVYFTAFDRSGLHHRLWKSDGTVAGTVLVHPEHATRGLGRAEILGAVGSRLFFAADDGVHGVEVWRTDGAPGSTALVADLSPGSAGTSFGDSSGVGLGGRFFFVAYSAGDPFGAIYVTGGTPETTRRVTLLASSGSTVLGAVGPKVYFAGALIRFGHGLGVTDGTASGTHLFDLNHPAQSSDPSQLTSTSGGLLFVGQRVTYSGYLYRTDGTAESTEPLAGTPLGTTDAFKIFPGSGGAFFFALSDETHLGWTDGRTSRELLPPGSFGVPVGNFEHAGRTSFLAPRVTPDGGEEVWVYSSDGTPEGTEAVAQAANRHLGYRYGLQTWAASVGDGVQRYLVQKIASLPDGLSYLRETDGSAVGTRSLVPIPVPKLWEVRAMAAAGGRVFVQFNELARRSALWASDGTPEGTRAVIVTNPDRDERYFFDHELVAAGGRIFLPVASASAGNELWVSDGSPEGTYPVADLAPGETSSNPTDLVAFGDRLLFSADDGVHGRELWVTDGTAPGTKLLEIHSGPQGSYPQAFKVIGDRAVFAADDGVHGLEIWTTDGTPEGTRLAADVLSGPLGSSPRNFEVFGDELYFDAGRQDVGYELWKLPISELSAGRQSIRL